MLPRWQCLARASPLRSSSVLPVSGYQLWQTHEGLCRGRPCLGRRHLAHGLWRCQSTHYLEGPWSDAAAEEPPARTPIRERLRHWVPADDELPRARAIPGDMPVLGGMANMLSRTQSTGSSTLDEIRSGDVSHADSPEGEPDSQDSEGAIVGIGRRSPGDLVELRSIGSRVPVFGIYLGFFGNRNHVYGVNGKWITSVGLSSRFTVPGFASLDEMEPVLAKIPRDATPDVFDDLRNNDKGPSRKDGVGLLVKMTRFRAQSEAVYQANLSNLETARKLLSQSDRPKHLSLLEIADILLLASLKTDAGFSAPALHAVHTALDRSETGFSRLSSSGDCHRPDHLVEVFPQEWDDVVARVVAMVRLYTNSRLDSDLYGLGFCTFLREAREAVVQSRRKREWTSHGMLKSSPVDVDNPHWSPSSRDVISFLEWWASYDLFDAGSRFHAYGPLILRALELYGDADLDQRTAWTFLQEITHIAPWEVPSRYKVRLPGVRITRGGGLSRASPGRLKESLRPDVAAGAREPRTGERVFCIDGPTTIIVDDGISLQPSDKPGEYWIHVHTADPASAIKPDSDLCRFLELIPETVYLPGHFQPMIPLELGERDWADYKSEGVAKQFSLAAGTPALTFSAKVNDAGHLLDYRIEPSRLADVVYLDPDDVSRFCNEPPAPRLAGYSFTVGTPPESGPYVPRRAVVAVKDLDEPGQNDLRTLYRLGQAIKQRRLSRGAWPYFFPKPAVSVSFHKGSRELRELGFVRVLPADPYVEVGNESSMGCAIVAVCMVLAGEVAARWCSSRGISIPFRRDSKLGHNADAAFAYATKEIYPLIKRGVEPTLKQRQELAKQTGGIETASEPGPYFLLGLDMYAKATSPLRRFADLVVHWQIHAALAHEREMGRRLDPSVDALDDMLPFTVAELSKMLPLLQMREKMARAMSRGILDWIVMALVRAWRFEGQALPPICFTVESRWGQGLLGRIDLFGLDAALDVDGLHGLRLLKDTQIGDQFEVELADMNVYSRHVLVKAKRFLGPGTDAGSSQQPALDEIASSSSRLASATEPALA